MIVRHIILFSLFVLCAGNSHADDHPLVLGAQESSPQIEEFVDRLEAALGLPVHTVERDLPTLSAWQNDAVATDLLLLQESPALGDGAQSLLLGWIPLRSGKVYYLYQYSSLPESQRETIVQFISDWLQPYRPSVSLETSALRSVAEAVAAARNGDYSQALAYLYPYLEKQHRDARAHAETLVVLEWAGRYLDAVILALSRPDLQLPLYASKSVVRSARAAGLFADAESFLLAGLQHAPDDPELLSLQVHLLSDQGRVEEAEQLVLQALEAHPQYADLWLAKYYLQVLKYDSYAALGAIQRANELVPSRYARRELLYSLERCGMPQLALRMLLTEPDLLTEDERFRLRRANNGMQIRWGKYEQASLEQLYAETDAALLQNEVLLSEAQSVEGAQAREHQKALEFNRMVVLRDRLQMQQLVDQWEILKHAGVEVPDYALQAVADALLYLQRPEPAAAIYAAVAERTPNNSAAWLGLYYSLHESNQYDRATELIARLVSEQAIWDRTKGYREPEGNPHRFAVELTAALDRLYRSEFDLAEEHLTRLFRQAPHRTDLRKAVGELENSRRHPRHAQQLFEQGLAVEPGHHGLQVALADSFMVRRQWRLAKKSIARQQEIYPDEGASLRLRDDWQRRNMRQLEGRISFGIGDSPDVDGQEIDWLLRNWTRPLDYDWRLAAFMQNRTADLPEGRATRTYTGIAFDRKTPDLSLFGQLALSDASDDRWLAELSGRYEVDDRWALLLGVARNGSAVSLRALETGSAGTEYRLGAEWWRNESLSAAVGFSLLDYDDGNQRTGLSASARWRLMAGPTMQLDNILRTATTQNSNPGGAYFAPDADFLLEDELQFRWISWRCYSDTLTQRASISSGGYWQQDYGWSVPFSLSYAHEWELQQRRLLVEYGTSFSQRSYDGTAENNLGLYLAFSWRY